MKQLLWVGKCIANYGWGRQDNNLPKMSLWMCCNMQTEGDLLDAVKVAKLPDKLIILPFGWAECSPHRTWNCPKEVEEENQRKRCEDRRNIIDVVWEELDIRRLRKRPRSQGMRAPSISWRCQEKKFSLGPPEGTQPCQHLSFSSVRTVLNSNPQKYKLIHLCCFKLLHL